MASSQQADLDLVMCHRSINYMAQMMEKKYGIPWIKVNFIGAESTAKALRKIANYFGDAELIDADRGGDRRGTGQGRAGPGRGAQTLRGQDWRCSSSAARALTITRTCSLTWACG